MRATEDKKGKKYIAAALCIGLLAGLTGCGNAETRINTATELIRNLDYQGALEELDAAEAEGENMRLVERSRGIAYMGLTEYGEAVQAFLNSLEGSNGFLEEIDFDLNYYLAAAYTKNEQYTEAESTYDAILALRPDEKDAYFLRGNVRMSLGNYQGAKEDFDRVVLMEPRNYDRLISIYEVLAHFGYKEAGQEYLQTALASGDKQMDNYVIGRIYYYLGEYQKACIALEEAREKGGGLGEMAKGEYKKALDAFQAGMKLGESSMMQSLSFNEIVAYEYLEEYEQAFVLMGNYLKNYPDDAQAQREYAFLSTR